MDDQTGPCIDSDSWALEAPDLDEIEAAIGNVATLCNVTPVLESAALNKRLNGRLLVKAEGLQRTGSFKLRGAVNRITQLNEGECRRGVIAFSSGNHGQAVAAAAKHFGIHALIVMPSDVSPLKLRKTTELGAEVVFYNKATQDREEVTARIVKSRGLVLVPPYDDRRIVAGAATLGLELLRQVASLGTSLDALVVNCSGGGLTAGCALARNALSPSTALIACEPEAFDDTARSLKLGTRVRNDLAAQSICDALQSPMPGQLTFKINREAIDECITVTDAEVIDAMAVASEEFGLVVEPGGAASLAAVLSGKVSIADKVVGITFSGSNIDRESFVKLLSRLETPVSAWRTHEL
ncbi:threonine/serine dehydratase [Mesorhizobium waimense]|uniref:Threonine/serine dehydratase n=1 Tax=Mesorhizobium waimense TaxID=1300307 RepID=A0A3A5K0U4_9HYPH|nr:threonine/serine dehydratase [Mesorhizobium waimense]RJT26316.1 threonine/serine dehydratase [Mesorhizobium waimense]